VSAALHTRLAGLYPGHWDRRYVPAKLNSDPLYGAVHDELRGSQLPLLDLGCGLGLLAFYLRERGHDFPIHGLDYDSRKIGGARVAATKGGYDAVAFDHHDARHGLPDHSGNVTILDILQFFQPAQQETLLTLAAERVAPGGKLIIRSGLRDDSWRFKITVAGDVFAKVTFWMKAGPIHYPSASDLHRVLSPYGQVRIEPLWGGTPFNNHRVVLERS
jgi:2-polyprenyl-3-methyl-5-hydroxy-6-metoxy-1,4-benzoquinol methylase